MRKLLIVFGLTIAATLISDRVFATTYSQLVVYGDSLSDLGRRSFAATGGIAPPYGSVTDGRFSNGPLWVEYLANSLGIATTPTTNFAVGGATTGAVNTVANGLSATNTPTAKPSQLIGIQQQINNYAIGDADALYVVWGGANDYLGGGTIDPRIPVDNLTTEIATLISRGAKNILVPNLPNLGALPGTRTTPNAAKLSALTQSHNFNLTRSIAALRQANPSVKLTILDVNDLFARVVNNPSQFGFSNVTDGCLLVSCQNPNTYLFWDSLHPTTAAHQLIGNFAVRAVSPTIAPAPFTILWLRKKLQSLSKLSSGAS